MNYDEYGEVINGSETYAIITNLLIVNQAVLIGWTDERNSHLDILFQHGNIVGNNQYRGGIKKTDLFVSILQYGAFGFKIEDKHYMPYVSEKLNLNYNVTAEKVTELLNGICKRIDNKYITLHPFENIILENIFKKWTEKKEDKEKNEEICCKS